MERAPELVGYDVAELITGIRRGTLASMVCRRQIPHVRIGPRLVRFDLVELREWIDARRVPSAAPRRQDATEAG